MDFDETRLYYSHQQLQQPSNNQTESTNVNNGTAAITGDDNDDDNINLGSCRRHFREFLRNYRLGQRLVYRERLLRMHRRSHNHSHSHQNAIKVDLSHLSEYDSALLGFLLHQPATLIPTCEHAAKDALQSILFDQQQQQQPHQLGDNNNNNDDNENGLEGAAGTMINSQQDLPWIQILWVGQLRPTPLRKIQSEHIGHLLSCPGIVISTSPVRNKAVRLLVRCSRCNDERTIDALIEGPGFGNILLPSACRNSAGAAVPPAGAGGEGEALQSVGSECGRFPYTVVPDESLFVDQQTLKLQEAPETVPTGEMPRSVMLAVDRSLVDVAPPGTRISVLAIPTLMTTGGAKRDGGGGGSKSVYLRVVGLVKDNDAHGEAVTFSPAEEEAFRALSRHPKVYDILTRSIAPNISGSYTVDIKKALVCQLSGGVSKKHGDGVRLRGDINVLLLGDPSMAKSQFLKYISKVAPVGIYTSGKGSSAAGLTASVVRDSKGEFYLEGGAMVLADGGIVCIDEFDKMRPNDRVALHEAMEQQTISVAKAGITTVLNSRASVLAAANPVFGRYDELKSAHENIDLMTTILSRFDVIFLVRDIRDEERDRSICQHVMGVHMGAAAAVGGSSHYDSGGHDNALFAPSYYDTNNSGSAAPEAIAENAMQVATTGEGELSVACMKKYIQFIKARCSPRLTEDSGKVLESNYVKIRDDVRQKSIAASGAGGSGRDNQAAIPITVRQLEALVRLSESLARLRLDDEVRREDVTEALRLFRVSTMAANAADDSAEGSAAAGYMAVAAMSREEIERTESFLRSRLVIGNNVNKQRLVEEATVQGFNPLLVGRALSIMTSRGDLLERNQGRLVKRVK